MNKRSKRWWTDKQVEQLRTLCGEMTLEEVAETMGKSYQSVKNKANKLKISTKFEKEHFYAFFRGERHLITGTVKECAELLGITEHTVRCYATPSLQERAMNYEDLDNVITAYRID